MHGEQRTSEKKQPLKDLAEDLRADIRNAKDPCLKAT